MPPGHLPLEDFLTNTPERRPIDIQLARGMIYLIWTRNVSKRPRWSRKMCVIWKPCLAC